MPRGIVLVRIASDWDAAVRAVRELQESPGKLCPHGSFVENWGPCMGVADLAVMVYAVSIEAVRQAAATIRREIDQLCESNAEGARTTLTSTIMVSTPMEVDQSPASLWEMAARWAADGDTSRETQLTELYLAEALRPLLALHVGPGRDERLDLSPEMRTFLDKITKAVNEAPSLSRLVGPITNTTAGNGGA